MIITYLKGGKVKLYIERSEVQITTANILTALTFIADCRERITAIEYQPTNLPETNLEKIQSKRI